MYVGVILLGLSLPRALGSWWALLPGGLIGLVFVVRAAFEVRTLWRELPGYGEYMKQVPYHLLSGIW